MIPESDLLLCCGRIQAGTATPEHIYPLLQHHLDWAYVIDLATYHGVFPMVYHVLSSTCAAALPAETLRAMRRQFHINARYNQSRTHELFRLLRLLETHGIFAVPYKGPTLAHTLYGDVRLRQFSDLDILVAWRDVEQATELLCSHGYRQCPPKDDPDLHQVMLLHDEQQIAVELHWNIVAHPRVHHSFQFDIARLHSRVQWVCWEQTNDQQAVTVPVLSPEDMLLVLCAHASSHLWDQVQFLYDIGTLITICPNLNWDRVVTHARQLGCERLLLISLLLTHDLLYVDMPEMIHACIRHDRYVPRLAARFRAWLFDPRGVVRRSNRGGPPGLFDLRRNVWHIKTRERFSEQLAYVLYVIRFYVRVLVMPNDKDFAAVSLPAGLSFLYTPLHMLRLVRTYAVDMWHGLFAGGVDERLRRPSTPPASGL